MSCKFGFFATISLLASSITLPFGAYSIELFKKVTRKPLLILPGCDSKPEIHFVAPDPSFMNTNLTQSLVTLMEDFVDLLRKDSPYPLNAHQKSTLERLVKLELVTTYSGFHFVLPSDVHESSLLLNQVDHFMALWFEPTSAQLAELQLREQIKNTISAMRSFLTIDNFIDLIKETMDSVSRLFSGIYLQSRPPPPPILNFVA